MVWSGRGTFGRHEYLEAGQRAAGRMVLATMSNAVEEIAPALLARGAERLPLGERRARTGLLAQE
jgi:hypothetical protein